jgi:hypothetical protein
LRRSLLPRCCAGSATEARLTDRSARVRVTETSRRGRIGRGDVARGYRPGGNWSKSPGGTLRWRNSTGRS